MIKKIKENNGDETMIIRGFRTVSVFDISQSTGDDIEELVAQTWLQVISILTRLLKPAQYLC